MSGRSSTVQSGGGYGYGLAERTVGTLRDRERVVWGLMIAGLVVDSVLTYYGVVNGVAEGNPAVRTSIDAFGTVVGVLAPKTVALSFALVGAAAVPARNRVVVPLALAIPWILAGSVNLAVLVLV